MTDVQHHNSTVFSTGGRLFHWVLIFLRLYLGRQVLPLGLCCPLCGMSAGSCAQVSQRSQARLSWMHNFPLPVLGDSGVTRRSCFSDCCKVVTSWSSSPMSLSSHTQRVRSVRVFGHCWHALTHISTKAPMVRLRPRGPDGNDSTTLLSGAHDGSLSTRLFQMNSSKPT